MKFGITYDANFESGLFEALRGSRVQLEDYLLERVYDSSGLELFIVLMCRDPMWKFKQRIRFDRKANCLYMDLMLDLPTMSSADNKTRRRIVAEKIVSEVPAIIGKYKLKDFDLPRFSSDLKEWFESNRWI